MALASFQEVRLGLRMLRKNPTFTVTAALTPALGIGANTAIFSAVNTLLLRPLPVQDAERVVVNVALREGFDPFGIGLLDYTAFRDRSHSFAGCGVSVPRSFNLVQRGEAEQINGAAIDAGYLEALAVKPVLGRAFTASDDGPGGTAVALIGYGLWQRRFGADKHVVGRSLNLEGRLTTIIGVLPPTFDLPAVTSVWVPLQTDFYGLPLAQRATHSYEMVARLKPGIEVKQADAELKAISHQLERELPQVRRGWSVKALELRQRLMSDLNGRIKDALVTLFTAVGFFWMICCVNVANLMLARGVAREQEIAVRRALGADWSRLTVQLLVESSLIAVIGGAAGLLFADLITPIVRSLNPIATVAVASVLGDIRMDARVVAFAVFVTVAAAVICPLVCIAKTLRADDPMGLIRAGGQRGSTGARRTRSLGALVVIEIAVAVPLLVGGGLMIQSFEHLERVQLGFRPEGRLTMHIELSPARYGAAQQRTMFAERLLEAIRDVPGVVSAGTTTNIPLSAPSYDSAYTIEGRLPVNPTEVPITSHRLVSAEYLQTLGVRLIRGRLFNEHDTATSLPVVVISDELARQAWPGEDPIGKRLRRGNQYQPNFRWLAVVGVVQNVKEDRDNFRINRPVWYLPYTQQEDITPTDHTVNGRLDLLVNARGDAATVMARVRDAVHSIDPEQAASSEMRMKDHVASVVVTDRFNAILMGVLAALGLTLAVIGVYGVMAYSVSMQTTEMGIRTALGASPWKIVGMIAAKGARLIATGLLLGLGLSIAFTRLLSGVLYGVTVSDPATFGLISVLLLAIALLACCVPALRASRVDPLVALRYE